MIAFMMYAVAVGLLAIVAGRAAEWVMRAAGWQVRWVWAGVLAVMLALLAAAPFRARPTGDAIDASRLNLPERTGDVLPMVPQDLATRLAAAAHAAERTLAAPFERGLLQLRARTTPQADAAAAAVALLLSLSAFLTMLAVERRFRAARRGWPVRTIGDVSVRISPTVGPVVLGVSRPEIVVPAWLLQRCEAEQFLVVAHEREHVRARDPLLLRAAGGALALMPWNPAAWYAYSRLRLGIELDCDARLLRGGARARAYGTLLIDMAERAEPLRLAALALTDDSSHLYQRILAMKASTPRFARSRGLVAVVVAAAALFAACETTMPTQSDVASMDAASAERALVLMKAARDTNVAYTVDGKTVSASEAHRLASDTITAIFMSKGGGRVDTIHLRLKLADAERDTVMAFKGTLSREVAVTSAADQAMRRRSPDGAADSGFVVSKFANGIGDSRVTIMIDGVVASDGQLRALNRDAIKSIEIIKGPSAARENPGVPNAERGIVKIFTKAGGAK